MAKKPDRNRNVEMAKHSSTRSQVNKRKANKNNEQKTEAHATRQRREREKKRRKNEKTSGKVNIEDKSRDMNNHLRTENRYKQTVHTSTDQTVRIRTIDVQLG